MIHDDNVALGRQEYEDMLVNDYYSTSNKLDKRTSDLYKAIYSSIKYPLKFYKHHMPFIDILTLGTNGNCLLSDKTHRYDANYIVINLLKKGIQCVATSVKWELNWYTSETQLTN